MKKRITSYAFNSAARTITFTDGNIFTLDQALLITNVTDNIIIYNFADPLLGGTMNNGVLTLDYNTTSMSDSDSLQIFIDIVDTNENNSILLQLIRRITKMLEPLMTVDSNNRQRVAVETMPGVTTTATLATSGGANVTGIGYPVTANTVGGNPYTLTASQPTQMVASMIDQRWEILNSSRNSYANAIRNKLTFS